MRILGINYSNDSAITILEDGRVLCALKEERISRIKHDRSFPARALQECLNKNQLTLNDMDAIAVFWNPGIHLKTLTYRFSGLPRHHLEFLYNIPNFILPNINENIEYMVQTFVFSNGKKLPIYYVTHHAAHAAAAFYRSPFKEAAILTVDGYGEKDSTVIWYGTQDGIKRLWHQEYPHSIGSFYAAVTQYLGFKPNWGEGKVMGLASYGKQRFYDEFSRILKISDDGFELDLSYFQYFIDRPARYSDKFVRLFGPPRRPGDDVFGGYEDIAASAQKITEDALLALARKARDLTKSDNFVMAGGVTLNCAANGRIVVNRIFKDHYFLPSACDAGSSLGAALYVYHEILGNKRTDFSMGLDYLGPEVGDEIEKLIDIAGLSWVAKGDEAIDRAAQLLASGKIGGIYQGRDEFGPRALGNRSILADPRDPKMKDILNLRVKFREPFRPFAPSILKEYVTEYFEDATESPFMLRIFKTKQEKLNEAGAITHVDGGARVQTVTQEQNPRYYRLIKRFGELTGTPMVLNTSFNIRGEPIVHTPAEALHCFVSTGMDFLLLGDYLFIKEEHG